MPYTDDDKAEALALANERGVGAASRELGIPQGSISRWRKEASMAGESDTSQLPGTEPPPEASPPADSRPSGKGSRGGSSKSSKKTAGQTPSVKRLEGLIGSIGAGLYLVNVYDAERVLQGGSELAESLHQVAKDNPAVRRVLNAALATTGWAQLGAALMPVLIPILANHGILPAEAAEAQGAPRPPGAGGSPTRPSAPAPEGNGHQPGAADTVPLSKAHASEATSQPAAAPPDGE